MTRKCVPNELYGQLGRKIDELKLRIDLERIPFQRAVNDLQQLIEGRTFQVSAQRWREQDGVIYFKVTSNGMTGPQWIEHFEKKGIQLSKWAKDVLNSPEFKPTNGVTTEIAVLKGMLFEDNDRVTSKIRIDADRRKLAKPNAEVACLIRDMFTDKEIKEMGLLWIVAMHEPIKDSDGLLALLGTRRHDDGGLDAYYGDSGGGWPRDPAFAFVSQVSS